MYTSEHRYIFVFVHGLVGQGSHAKLFAESASYFTQAHVRFINTRYAIPYIYVIDIARDRTYVVCAPHRSSRAISLAGTLAYLELQMLQNPPQSIQNIKKKLGGMLPDPPRSAAPRPVPPPAEPPFPESWIRHCNGLLHRSR